MHLRRVGRRVSQLSSDAESDAARPRRLAPERRFSEDENNQHRSLRAGELIVTAFHTLMLDESGQGLVEYALILALVAVVAIVGLGAVRTKTDSTLSNVSNKMV